ncbi:MAG: prevent host death family protein [Candidatus Scalindua rubra]|uniref:Prevent host death family protein n=1 Tax=Candidatus Scalindua rubra TaxID=1872076 RepID=A0A1E3X6L8_9BACT|nr:MAG: prevent host death family protein [Candidatus Scalindua rubra]
MINMYIYHIHKQERCDMKASIIDLRYKMKDVLKALDRKEEVTILYHGKVKGVIVPVNNKKQKNVKDHPFFGMLKDNNISVSEEMQNLRGPRY